MLLATGTYVGEGFDDARLDMLFLTRPVDTPLASLFVHVAQTVASDAEGAERARSATERFLFQRLQTLPETKNASASMLICRSPSTVWDDWKSTCFAPMRVAVEPDGAQHLADPIVYRRDRRKDRVLRRWYGARPRPRHHIASTQRSVARAHEPTEDRQPAMIPK